MATIKVKHLVRFNGPANGLPRYFWQPSPRLRKLGWHGQRVPLDWANYDDASALELAAAARARELNEEADAKYLQASRISVSPPAVRTLGDVIRAYQASDGFKAKAAATQRSYRQCLEKLEFWGGDVAVRLIDTPRVRKLHQALIKTPAFANAVIRVLRLLLEFARGQGWITVNPAIRPGLATAEPAGIIWPRAAVDAFVEAADAAKLWSIGTAVMLNEWLGQREADILRLTASSLRAGSLWVRQGKTGAGVALPVQMVPHLVARLEEEAVRAGALKASLGPDDPVPATLLICERTRLPWKADHFRHAFAEVRAAAAKIQPEFEIDYLMPGRDPTDPKAFMIAMKDLTFMRLRHTAVTRMGEAEVDTKLIATISGHSLATVDGILERYMVRTSKMAQLAFGQRAEAEGKGVPTKAEAVNKNGT